MKQQTNGKMKTLIKVKQGHIEDAIRIKALRGSKSRNCPIALALNEHFKKKGSIAGWVVCIVGGNYSDMPRSCRRFIARFDNGQSVKPFNFIFTPR